jgi:hypothetical protein
MTARIQQNVVPRGQYSTTKHRLQRGSVSEATLTVSFAVVALVTAVVLGFLYLQQVFGTAAHGSTIQELEQTMLDLKEQQKELELEGASLRSIQSVEKRVEELNLVSANSVGYLAPRPNHVAWQN